MRCPVVHFNLLIRGSKGGLVGHNLVQSDGPAQDDKGIASRASKWKLCFQIRAIFWSNASCLHAAQVLFLFLFSKTLTLMLNAHGIQTPSSSLSFWKYSTTHFLVHGRGYLMACEL